MDLKAGGLCSLHSQIFKIGMKVSSNRIQDIRKYYGSLLQQNFSVDESKQLIMTLLLEYSAYSKNEILLYPGRALSESELLKVHFAVQDLLKNKPIQYVIGRLDFLDVVLQVNEEVLIPRPETEELVEIIRKDEQDRRGEAIKILDIGTGSGAIAIALKKYFHNAEVYALDISSAALAIAQKNAQENEVNIRFFSHDILKDDISYLGKFDIVVSNPPYVMQKEKEKMKTNVLDYEPDIALFVDDTHPLIFYEKIALLSKNLLRKRASLYLEINQYLAEDTQRLFLRNMQTKIVKDFRGNWRFLKATILA